ncbi:MAG TPA: hypothetical protein VM240_09605 [Verrucomicrobiae bacterium]|nr:hypothetical protein [Verrucomicrobiae bacterium]
MALTLPTVALAQSDEEILRRDGGTELPPAQREDDDLDEQVFYSGFGVSRVETDFANLGEAVNLDVTLGFRIPTVKWIGVEVDIGQTIIPGEYREPRPAQSATPACGVVPVPGCGQAAQPAEEGARDANRDEFAMQALGLSIALKSPGRFYVMGRYGYRYLITSNDRLNEQRSGNGLGAGVGYRWGKGLSGVELTYKELGENVDSIGLTFYARFNRR